MRLSFAKYQGAGNDFIVIDDRALDFPIQDRDLIARLCDRKYGIGADGILLLHKGDEAPFRMRIVNADGGEAGMCGNGIRCLFRHLEIEELAHERCLIETLAGPHEVWRAGDRIGVHLPRVEVIAERVPLASFYGTLVYTGTLNYVLFDDEKVSWEELVQASRHVFPDGINLHQAHWDSEREELQVKTHERGVGEVHACGTGVTACALVAGQALKLQGPIRVRPASQELLEVERKEGGADLLGPALFVFRGALELT